MSGIVFLIFLVLIVTRAYASSKKNGNNAWDTPKTSVVRSKARPKAEPKPQPAATPSFSFGERDHQHIVPADLSAERQLEQLEILREAGLYTKEEYREAKEKILGKK